jgi:hypothetical protein
MEVQEAVPSLRSGFRRRLKRRLTASSSTWNIVEIEKQWSLRIGPQKVRISGAPHFVGHPSFAGSSHGRQRALSAAIRLITNCFGSLDGYVYPGLRRKTTPTAKLLGTPVATSPSRFARATRRSLRAHPEMKKDAECKRHLALLTFYNQHSIFKRVNETRSAGLYLPWSEQVKEKSTDLGY